MRQYIAILIFAGLAVVCGCSGQKEKREHITHPLVWKYLYYPSHLGACNISQDNGYPKSYLVSFSNDTEVLTEITRQCQGRFDHPPGETNRYPALTKVLQQSGIGVSNAIVARDLRDLVQLVAKASNDITQSYLVDSVTRTGNAWVIEAPYMGHFDDAHRRPSKVIHTIVVDDDDKLIDIIEHIHPRPMDMEAQNSD